VVQNRRFSMDMSLGNAQTAAGCKFYEGIFVTLILMNERWGENAFSSLTITPDVPVITNFTWRYGILNTHKVCYSPMK